MMVMRNYSIILVFFSFFSHVFAQTGSIRGTVMDERTGETLIGANILIGEGRGTVTDFEGKFSISVEDGSYDLQISYVGYETQHLSVNVAGKPVLLEVRLKSLVIDEVIIIADVARSRETPVAFTNVLPKQIEEELAGQDIPMILNSTPGVYATAQGGGDGDARITIRGFDQRNIAVMIDGIPVNDMENGWVYWSNWFGLDQVTRTIQVQRGLGASKLALPSVGGTMNIITKGLESASEGTFTQRVTSEGKFTTSFGYSSGSLKNGWGVTVAGASKSGNGWVDNTSSQAWFYYVKIDKRLKRHILSVSAMGAPQSHDQRSYKRAIATYDAEFARQQGVPLDDTSANGDYLYRPPIYDNGVGYNQHWGYLRRDRFNPNAPEEKLSARTNFYHKPQFSLRDYWNVTEKLSVSNIAYLSLGTGGGIRTQHSIRETQLIQDPEDPKYGSIDWQSIYDANSKPTQTPFGLIEPIDPRYSDSLYYSDNYMTAQHNDHVWYGLLSTANYSPTNNLHFAGGIDLRSYKGIHYTTVTDLLGGDYVINDIDIRPDYDADSSQAMKYIGDVIDYHEEGLVRWGGTFLQAEYMTENLTAFINVTTALSGYKRINYFEDSESGWRWTPGFTIKLGGNYNIGPRMNAFFNLGYISRVRAFRYFFKGYTTEWQDETDNERVKAIETGYNFHSPRFTVNVNTYFTQWENKPTSRVYSTHILGPGEQGYDPDEPENNNIRVYADIPGMDAVHMGIEVDFIYKILRNLDFQGLFSFGDWTWDKRVTGLQFYNYDTYQAVDKVIDFDARGIHVGDAAQFQLGASLRYEPFQGLYLNTRITHFGKYYSNFTPESTTDEEGNPVDSWKIPDYQMLDFHTGYRFRLTPEDRVSFGINFSMLNVLNTKYIADAVNNDPYNSIPSDDFDAKSATVFFGMGRRFNASFQVNF